MQRATLIVNALAGRKKSIQRLVPELLRVLGRRGIVANAALTTAAGEATLLAAEAVSTGADTVFACGGNGTVNEVLQGLVGTGTALGVVPIGTANVLARNLGLSGDPVTSLQEQLNFQPRPISIGHARYATYDGEATRYFIVMAGAGPDGALVYRLLVGKRSGLGRMAYYAHALRLFLTRRFPPFKVEYRRSGFAGLHQQLGVCVMCSHVEDLGGAFRRLMSGSSLLEADLSLAVVKPPASISLPAWFALSGLGLHAHNRWLETARVSEFRCIPVEPSHRIHVELDGEWVGYLPMSVDLLPRGVLLLMPKASEDDGL